MIGDFDLLLWSARSRAQMTVRSAKVALPIHFLLPLSTKASPSPASARAPRLRGCPPPRSPPAPRDCSPPSDVPGTSPTGTGTVPATPKPGRHSRRHTATPRPGSPKPSWTSAARPPDQGKPASPYPLRKASRLPDPAAPARHADCSVDSVGLPAPRLIRLMSACRTPDRSASSRWESPQATRASRYCSVSPVPWKSDWKSPEPGCGLAGADELADCASSLPADETTGG